MEATGGRRHRPPRGTFQPGGSSASLPYESLLGRLSGGHEPHGPADALARLPSHQSAPDDGHPPIPDDVFHEDGRRAVGHLSPGQLAPRPR